MLDECGARIALGLLSVFVLAAPLAVGRFIRWRGEKVARERRKRLLYSDAWGIVDFYIHDAIKDKPDRIKLSIRHDILKSFEKTCPDGMKGEGVYDGDILEKWIRYNAIRILIAHRGELGPLA